MNPQQSPRAAWASNDDQSIFNLIVILLGVGVGSYLIWNTSHDQISAGVMALRHREMLLLGHVTERFRVADAQMMRTDPYGVTLRDLYGISHAIGLFWRIPACIFIAMLAALCTVRAAPARYKRAFDLDALFREQVITFKAAAAFLNRKLRLARLPDGDPRPADYALTGEDWIDRYALDACGAFDELGACGALVRQLGPRWTGPDRASSAVQALFVAFAMHLAEQREAATMLLGRISVSLAGDDQGSREGPEKPLPIPDAVAGEVAKLLEDQERFEQAREACAAHAFTAPALMTLLNVARIRSGVLAPAQFAWLKLVDRPLWYALHSLGFETEGTGRYLHPNARVEALGARDHWAVERATGAPVTKPDLDRAIDALRRTHARRSGANQPDQHATSHTATSRPHGGDDVI
jgi:intracellular multiplication protein IcmP